MKRPAIMLHEASRRAQSFQNWALYHLSHDRPADVEREGQLLIDALWELGFRPSSHDVAENS